VSSHPHLINFLTSKKAIKKHRKTFSGLEQLKLQGSLSFDYVFWHKIV